jgi:beta-lactamase superfamily II metal-dependent hydrolase
MIEINPEIKLYILNVGHGDSIIIEFPNKNSFGIIDCNLNCKTNKGYETTKPLKDSEPKVLTFFRNIKTKGIEFEIEFEIEFVCLTHPHDDHYKGFSELLNWFKNNNILVKEFWDFGCSARKAMTLLTYAQHSNSLELKERANEFNNLYKIRFELEQFHNMEYRMITSPQKSFWHNELVEIDAIAPIASHIELYTNMLMCPSESEKRNFIKNNDCKWVADDNIVSSAFIIKYNNINLLLGGDVINEGWYKIINKKYDINCHIVKVSHHGSIHSNFPFLIEEKENKQIPLWAYMNASTNKTKAIISGGYRKQLPHKDTINSLNAMDIQWYCTGSCKGDFSYYVPEGIPESLKYHFEKAKFVEVSEDYENGHGDITICCFLNGKFIVNSEFGIKSKEKEKEEEEVLS